MDVDSLIVFKWMWISYIIVIHCFYALPARAALQMRFLLLGIVKYNKIKKESQSIHVSKFWLYEAPYSLCDYCSNTVQ